MKLASNRHTTEGQADANPSSLVALQDASAKAADMLAHLMHASALSEGRFGETSSFVPRALGRRRDWIEDAVDALGVNGLGLAGHRRPAGSWSRRLQPERDETERLGLRAT